MKRKLSRKQLRAVFAKLHRSYEQSGKRKDIKKDKEIKALHAGWRKSKLGRYYFENRRNRSDKKTKVGYI